VDYRSRLAHRQHAERERERVSRRRAEQQTGERRQIVIGANKRNIKKRKRVQRERENETVTGRQYCRVKWQKY
jgi:hypothetical protein